MIYGSLCSGIEAATQAWHPLGWKPAFFSEIEKFPSAVLEHHYPHVPNYGDMTKFQEWPDHAIDLLVGGTPCQSFSVAGLRKGLDDPRGNLMLTYLAIARRYRPRWLVWENVPGVLSSNAGRDFGTFLGALGQLGYGFAYRVLDAQYVRTRSFARAVPQRRRRVFVVGCLGDWRRAAAVLFDGQSLRGDSPPRREAGQRPAPTLSARTKGGGGLGTDFDIDGGLIRDVAHALRGEGFDASEDETGRGTPLIPAVSPALKARDAKGPSSDGDGDGAPILPVAFAQNSRDEVRLLGGDGSISGALAAEPGMKQTTYVAEQASVAFDLRGRDGGAMPEGPHDTAAMRAASGGSSRSYIAQPMAVRRLTPTECARLQGFPDHHTRIPWRGKDAEDCPDGPQYKAYGNSMAVNVMQWIGERIQMVDQIEQKQEHAA